MSIRAAVHQRFVEDVVRAVRPKAHHGKKGGKRESAAGGGDAEQWKVLVIDRAARDVLAAAVRMYDLMSEGVTLVEPLEIGRQPVKNMEAVYVMAPTRASVDKLVEDFEGVEADPTPMYAKAHVFFLQPVSDELMDVIKGSDKLLEHLEAMVELNLDFLALEERVFSVNRPDALSRCFSPEASQDITKDELHVIADKLATVCATLKEYPIIRYAETDLQSENSKLLAVYLQKRLDVLKRGSPDYAEAIGEKARGTLLLVDRSFDVMTPLVHEFTYQAMIHDLLASKLKGTEYSFTSKSNEGSRLAKKAMLDETDVLWPMLRHMHIADSMNWIVESFNDFLKKNKAVKFAKKSKVKSLSEMTEAMRAMPQFQELLEKYTLHINLSSDCMQHFNKGLDRVAAIEQDMATGSDAKGKEVKGVMTRLYDLLKSGEAGDEGELSNDDKIRLLMLYIISQKGIKDDDRERLLKIAKLDGAEDTKCISNLKFLGVTLLRQQRSLKRMAIMATGGKRVLKDNAPDYELSRYTPKLASLMEDALGGTLKATDAPYLNEKEAKSDALQESKAEATVSLRKPKTPGWASKKRSSAAPSAARESKRESTAADGASGAKLMVFMLGGLTYSEARSAYTVAEQLKRDVIIGTTNMLTPGEFVQSLRDLQKPPMLEEKDKPKGKAEAQLP